MLKNTCVACLQPFENTEELYEIKGNYCQDCVNKANAVVDKKRVDNYSTKEPDTVHYNHYQPIQIMEEETQPVLDISPENPEVVEPDTI